MRQIKDATGADMGRFKASYKAYANAILRKKMDPQGNIMPTDVDSDSPIIVPMPSSVHSALVDMCLDADWGDMTKPENGYDVKITRTGTSFTDTRYAVMGLPGTKPIHDDPVVMKSILENLPKLDTIWKFPDEEEMSKIRRCADRLKANFSVARRSSSAWNDPSAYDEPSMSVTPESVERTGDPDPEPEEVPEPAEEVEEAVVEESVEEETPEPKKEKPKTVSTPEDVAGAMGLTPIDHPKVEEGLAEGCPPCYGQISVVIKEYPDICTKRCAYEYACRNAEEEIQGG
jgi:hypothetical protein